MLPGITQEETPLTATGIMQTILMLVKIETGMVILCLLIGALRTLPTIIQQTADITISGLSLMVHTLQILRVLTMPENIMFALILSQEIPMLTQISKILAVKIMKYQEHGRV